MRSTLRTLAFLAPLLAGVAFAPNARADEDSAAFQANTGLHFGIGPVFLFPSDGGPMGGGLDADLRYGIGLDPVVVAPGARAAGYVLSGHFIGFAMPTLRVTLPVGPLAPFVVGGVGPGYVSDEKKGGVALMGGGGLMLHLGRFFGIGAEATYQTITGTDFKTLTVGPSLLIGF
ncbi:MAG TPA: hypothetical protein VFS43_44030 [Polyangiaceae bacterium]|nr:hypothetical protein [Polyangiaceae bacterium]